MISDVSLMIKTFERKDCLKKLLNSVRKMQLDCQVLIADDSKEPYKDEIMSEYSDIVTKYLVMPFDVGVSEGRNELLKYVETPYFILCDDDFIFDYRSDITYMKHLLETSDLDLLGGLYYDVYPLNFGNIIGYFTSILLRTRTKTHRTVKASLLKRLFNRKKGIPRRYFGNFHETSDGHWKVIPVEYREPFVRCDMVLNFFIAKTEAVRQKVGGWNPALKSGEHEEFFFAARSSGLLVGHTEAFGVLHIPKTNRRYRHYRARGYVYKSPKFR